MRLLANWTYLRHTHTHTPAEPTVGKWFGTHIQSCARYRFSSLSEIERKEKCFPDRNLKIKGALGASHLHFQVIHMDYFSYLL